jgi:organic radical activating enzyme
MSSTGHLNEIFSSFQGEGIYVGFKQLFLRFCSCNITCQYCDTPQALEISSHCKCETSPGSLKFEKIPNPISIEDLTKKTTELWGKDKHHSLCLTGGEPLMQVNFLTSFLPEIKKKDIKIYLETNGTLPDFFSEVKGLIDILAMDIKLPSTTGLESYIKDHRKFLNLAFKAKIETFVKIIITRDTKSTEIKEASEMITNISDSIPLVLQPATPAGKIHKPLPEQIFSFFNIAKKKLKTVRVIPQVHKQMGIR